MKFKSSAQRKAVMSKLNSNGGSRASTRVPTTMNRYSSKTIALGKQLVKAEDRLNYLDIQRELEMKKDNPSDTILIRNDIAREKALANYYDLTEDSLKSIKSDDKNISNKKFLHGDFDGDGVPNNKDCYPFDKNKQGALHDFNMRRLKAQEQALEIQRKKVESKLEEQRETLQTKLAISKSKQGIRNANMKQKQSIIDEINREKQKIKDLQLANEKAKKEIFNNSALGKISKRTSSLSKDTINKTKKYLSTPENKKKATNFLKAIDKFF